MYDGLLDIIKNLLLPRLETAEALPEGNTRKVVC